MTITIYKDLEQGTPEWHQARCGIVTASSVKKIVTETKLELANNKGSREYLCELIAERLTGRADVLNIGYNGIRGHFEEERAIATYEEIYEPVERVGFVTNDAFGYTLGFSPDALIDGGFAEVKSKLNKLQILYILDGGIPSEHKLQVLQGFLVTDAKRCVFTSFSNGFNMWRHETKRDEKQLDTLKYTLDSFHKLLFETETRLKERMAEYDSMGDLVPVDYVEVQTSANDDELTFEE